MKKLLIFCIYPLVTLAAPQTHEIEVNLADFCEDLKPATSVEKCPINCDKQETNGTLTLLDFSKSINEIVSPDICTNIKKLTQSSVDPIELIKKDEDGDTWKIKFYFGFSRTSYRPTDMKLSSSRVNVIVKDFEFDERTSANFYNPFTWTKPMNALQWIDEPTNTFAFSLEKGKNAFYLTAFHPKFLKKRFQTAHVTGTIDGVAVDKQMPINESFDGYNNQVGEMFLVRFENTHKQMDWQLGYGRRIQFFDTEKKGKLTYIPRVDVGITSGENYTVYTQEGQYWEYDGFRDKHRIQGINVSVGHRLEYEKNRLTLFVDQKVSGSRLKHGFMDGEASYNMIYSPVTFGVGLNIYKKRRNSAGVKSKEVP
jgi:hypothetical protein